MRVLVTGADGQLGRALVEAFGAWGHTVVATDAPTMDITRRDEVLAAVSETAPDAVVHAAAWTDVDGCEADPDRALATNALGTRHVAEAARLVGASVCYLSSDYVFSGDPHDRALASAGDPRPYHEWDQPGPISVYGRSKLAGEMVLAPGDTVVRTSWLCGHHGRNFVRTVLDRAAAGSALTVVDDQHGSPTFADDLAPMICRLVSERRPGVFHVTNQGATTWFGLARAVLETAGYDAGMVSPVATAELVPARPAPRPAWSVLDNAALRLSGIPLLPDYHEPLERLVKELFSR